MIEVHIGTTTDRTIKHYSPSKTVREILDDNNIDYSYTSILIDSANIKADEMDMSLSQLNKTEKCFIIAAVKAESA